MRLEEKKELTQRLSSLLSESGTVYVTDFTGLDVKSMTDFRARLRENGLQYRVVKNTLMRRALEGLDFPDLSEHLEGPTGLVLGRDDPVLPAKIVKEFAREHDDRPIVKVGVVDRQPIAADVVARMADLPSREELLGSIAGGLTASVAGVVGVLEGLMRDIAHLIQEVARKGETAGES